MSQDFLLNHLNTRHITLIHASARIAEAICVLVWYKVPGIINQEGKCWSLSILPGWFWSVQQCPLPWYWGSTHSRASTINCFCFTFHRNLYGSFAQTTVNNWAWCIACRLGHSFPHTRARGKQGPFIATHEGMGSRDHSLLQLTHHRKTRMRHSLIPVQLILFLNVFP